MILVLAWSLSACASALWNKPGASETDLAADRLACVNQSQRRANGGNVAPDQLVTDPDRFKACMTGKGWRASH